MDCSRVRELLMPLHDEELPREQAEAVCRHLVQCKECQAELDQLELLDERLAEHEAATQVEAPPALWTSIERQLTSGEPSTTPRPRFAWIRRPLTLAAGITLFLVAGGLIAFLSDKSTSSAQAAVIDYSVLMNGVAADVRGAIQRFLGYYHAEPVDAKAAHTAAPDLSFDLPAELPGGYRLVQAYRLKFGQSTGIAATYDRNGQPIFLIFHSMSHNVKGPGATSCMIGGLHGSQIEVGGWHLAHIMDRTTCHCVLSKLDPGTELEAIVRAIAPDLPAEMPQRMH